MKEIILKSLKELINDRYLLILVSVLILMSILFAINIGLSIHPSELQLVSHYSAFGVTHLYRDQWFYLLVFVAFEPIVALLNAIIAIKIFVIKGRSLAIMLVWLGIGTMFLGWITVSAVLNVWIPL